MVEGSSFENCRRGNPTRGSNPLISAIDPRGSNASDWFVVARDERIRKTEARSRHLSSSDVAESGSRTLSILRKLEAKWLVIRDLILSSPQSKISR